MSHLEGKLLTGAELDRWNSLIQHSENSTIFHSSVWVTHMASVIGAKPVFIGVFEENGIVGGCCMYMRNVFPGMIVGSTRAPFVPWGGFVLDIRRNKNNRDKYESKERQIISIILEKIQALNPLQINLVNSPSFSDIRPLLNRGWQGQVFYCYIRPLNDTRIESYSSSVRSNFVRAEKLGIVVQKEYRPDILWRLMEATFAKNNMKVPCQKESLFSLMEMVFQNNLGAIWTASTSAGEPISAEFVLFDKKTAYGWLAGTDPETLNTGVKSYFEHKVQDDLRLMGFQQYNMMGANMPNLARFYSQFNPQLVPYYGVSKTKYVGWLLDRMR